VSSSRETTSIFSIGLENFENDVLEEDRAVLLLCMYRDTEFQRQIEIIEALHKIYAAKLKTCVLEEEFIEVFMERYSIKGTPTFLIFIRGRESARMLGHASSETLRDFISETLSSN
jgi:thioredoxin-like negative regulator of GroEL